MRLEDAKRILDLTKFTCKDTKTHIEKSFPCFEDFVLYMKTYPNYWVIYDCDGDEIEIDYFEKGDIKITLSYEQTFCRKQKISNVLKAFYFLMKQYGV